MPAEEFVFVIYELALAPANVKVIINISKGFFFRKKKNK